MTKRTIYAMLVVVVLLLTGCREKKIIPDDTLADIFHDAFVSNAYIGEKRVNLDSLQVYEAIFNRYGYTSDDVIHTVGNFSRRKSARLGMVVEQAILRLEKESKEYAGKVVILDTIRNVAVRTFTTEVYTDSLIKASKRADSTLLKVRISPIEKGEYVVKFNYKCDGDIDKYPSKAEFYFEDEDGFRHGYASVSLRPTGLINRTIVSRGEAVALVLNLGEFEKDEGEKKKRYPKDQSITIRNLKVVHKLKADEAVERLFEKYVDFKIFTNEFLYPKDSLALSADSTRVSTTSARND